MEIPYGPERKPWRETLSEMAVAGGGGLLISPPSRDPLQLSSYPAVPGVTQELYQLSSSGLASTQVERALRETQEQVDHVTAHFLGFQANEKKLNLPFLSHLCHIHIANEGNPFDLSQSGASVDTKWLERNVLDYVASLWNAKWPHDPSDPASYWGYLLPIGVTEANIFSVCTARDYLSGMFVVSETPDLCHAPPSKSYLQGEFKVQCANASRPVGFYSADAHYGVAKALQVCDIPSFHKLGKELYPEENPLGGAWPLAVPCENGDAGPGNMDVKVLTKFVDFFSGKGHPIIIVFNYGSTFKGAYDDIAGAEKALLPVLKKNGMYERRVVHPVSREVVTRSGFWFHVDAALAGFYMPFVEMGYRQGLIEEKPGPIFDFRLESVSSVAASVGKHLGSPWPCGVYITRTGLQLALAANLEPTFSCPRNGHIAPVLWSHFSSKDFNYQVQKISDMLEVADYAEKRLRALEEELRQDLWVSRTHLSLAIYFKKTNPEIFRKYSLSTKTLHVCGEVREYCHIYVMHHVQKQSIDSFVEDLKMPGAFPAQGTTGH